MSFKCIHIADVHFRGLKRHDEYRQVFSNLFVKASELKPDAIFVGGDIVHSKTQGISPELINVLNWWFTGLASIAPTHIVLGNHDGLILNQNRLDAITPIIEALNNPRLFLYKKSGVYPTGVKGYNWCVFSCFDEEGWKNVKPVKKQINIATFHGAVSGCLTDVDWELNGDVNLSFFDDYDFAFLGDIHKRQFLDLGQRVAYSGSTIQQNYGEEIEKGFLFWEINSKNDYTTQFFALENPHPFVTIDWKDDFNTTIESLHNYQDNCRFRIKSKSPLNQNDIKLLQTFLREKKNAKEITFKHEGVDQSIKHIEDTKKLFNIWDNESRLKILSNFFGNTVTDVQLNKINQIFIDGLDHIPEEQNRRPNNWEIKSFEFDNLFSYGEGNSINFENMNGIVGIFGKNAAGKSSIPGSLMYTLFNATDRGSMKNLHVINTRKENAQGRLVIEVNQQKYLIERSTKKIHKKKEIYAPTDLTIHKINDNGSTLNESDEQRRETEKVLRELIGGSEEFLMTSFASQGNINAFINEKSGSRKYYLSKFMNLDIFEELSKISKEKVSELKGKLKFFQDKNWNDLRNKANDEISSNFEKISKIETDLSNFKTKEVEVRLLLENIKTKNINIDLIKELENEISLLSNMIAKDSQLIEQYHNESQDLDTKINKFSQIQEQFDINELKNERDRLTQLKNQLSLILNQLEDSKKDIQKKKDANNLLKSVPCGDNFPTCRFIKNAYEEYRNIGESESKLSSLQQTSNELSQLIIDIEKEQIHKKIEKYEELLIKNKQNQLSRQMISQKMEILLEKKNGNISKLDKSSERLTELTRNLSKNDEEMLIDYQNELQDLKKKINSNEVELISIKGKNAYLEKMLESYQLEELKYNELLDDWKIYELFNNCVSKKGLPAKLLKEMLPSLNKEVKDILSGVVDFTIDIEIDDDNLEVYLNYGDQRRIIECASGMEKMITSMAIRAGLINISNLPKSNIFIIDEGFGALDDTNTESCVRLLHSFKKFFKTILVISHVDAIKDAVDDILNIESDGVDSYVRFE